MSDAPPIQRLEHWTLVSTDIEKTKRFYTDVLGAELVARGEGYVYRFGTNQLNIHGPGVDGEPNADPPVAPGGADLCFVWDGPIDGAVAHLESLGVPIELGPVPRYGARGDGASVYFRDPDRSLLELISYS
jgi:catechol 2,3-dioxygenase-like lactoylglutathione lyase family enzyme